MDIEVFLSDYETEARIRRAHAISTEIESYFSFKTSDVMDYGCKTGLVALNLKNKVNRLFLIDSCEKMIQSANYKLTLKPQTNIETYCGDLLDVNLNIEFDVIYASLVFLQMKDVQAKLNQLLSYLKKSGKLIVVDLLAENRKVPGSKENFHISPGFTIAKITELLETAGFTEVMGRKFYSSYKRVNDTSHPYSLFSMIGVKA